MGGGALAAVSRSISDVRVEFGQTAFPLRTTTHLPNPQSTLTFVMLRANKFMCVNVLNKVLLLGCDDHVASGLAVVAHALHAVDLGQLMDDPPVFSVHGWETVAPLWLLSLQNISNACPLGKSALLES